MTEPLRDPKKLQAQVEEFQRTQRHLSILASQRQQMLMQVEEMKMAQEYLEGSKEGGVIYKAIGNLLVETDKKSAKKEVDERIGVFELRENTLKKQEDDVHQKLEKMRKELERATASS